MANKVLFPNEIVIKTKLFRVEQDWEVPIPGFFIVASLRKIKSVAEFSDEETAEFAKLVRDVRRGMREVLGIEEVYLFQNEDSMHNFHLWMFPRHKWMDKFGRRIKSVRPIMDYAKESMKTEEVFCEVRGAVKKMKEYFSNIKKS